MSVDRRTDCYSSTTEGKEGLQIEDASTRFLELRIDRVNGGVHLADRSTHGLRGFHLSQHPLEVEDLGVVLTPHVGLHSRVDRDGVDEPSTLVHVDLDGGGVVVGEIAIDVRHGGRAS